MILQNFIIFLFNATTAPSSFDRYIIGWCSVWYLFFIVRTSKSFRFSCRLPFSHCMSKSNTHIAQYVRHCFPFHVKALRSQPPKINSNVRNLHGQIYAGPRKSGIKALGTIREEGIDRASAASGTGLLVRRIIPGERVYWRVPECKCFHKEPRVGCGTRLFRCWCRKWNKCLLSLNNCAATCK